MTRLEVENPFVLTPPSPQNAVDVFAGEWASQFPAEGPPIVAGAMPLFSDPRLGWADTALRELGQAGFGGQEVLELGPLEAGQSYGLGRMGASSILAIEANSRAFLKCLIAKEVLGMSQAHFLLGDALAFMRETDQTFDVGVACAFLNHMTNPVEVVSLLARCCRSVFIWNVVFDESIFVKQPELRQAFAPPVEAEFGGFRHTLHPHDYGSGYDFRIFRGAGAKASAWMRPGEIVAAVQHFGFRSVRHEVEENPFGKSVSIAAAK